MELTCPRCKSAIEPGDVNVQAATAHCLHCGEVFRISGKTDTAPEKPPIHLPKGFTQSRQLDDMVITRPWRSAKYYFLAFMCLIWDGWLILWYAIVIYGHAPLYMILFPLPIAAIGIILTYIVLAGLLNRTEIRINNSQLSVRHSPLPWPGNTTLMVEAIKQIYCEAWINFVKYNHHRDSTTYIVLALLAGGKRLVLVSGLEQAEHAHFIEQEIEKRLGIINHRIPGEI